MTKRVLNILITIILMISCDNNKIKESPNYWLNKETKSIKFPIDLNYLQKVTILSGKEERLMKFVAVINDIKRKDSTLTKEDIDSIANLVAKSLDISDVDEPYLILDRKYISKEKILHTNKLAYQALLESNWKNTVSFKDYQEYVLPYKLTNEIFDAWRDALYSSHKKLISSRPALKNLDSLYQYHTTKTYNELSSKVSMRKYYLSEENYTWLNMTKEGNCVSRCRYAIYHLRAAGVPATFDYIPNWGNRPYAKHAYVGLANKKIQVPKLLENTNDPKNLVDNLNAVSIEPEILQLFTKQKLPKGLYIQYEKTIPKIYRETWSAQPEMKTLLLNIPKKELFLDLIKPNMVDVTAQYLETADVKTRKSLFRSNDMAYLATFDLKGWTPVAFTTFDWFGKAIFKDVGKNILYLPMTYNSEFSPFENPFILSNSGIKKELICNKDKLINMKIIRKFPLFSYKHSVDLKGCRIEGSNSRDFNDAKILYTVKDLIFNTKQLDFKNPVNFRFIRMIAPEGRKILISEIECYKKEHNIYRKLKDVNFQKDIINVETSNAFDGDFKTYLEEKFVVFDFGTSAAVSRIRFTPMNDCNYIVPNNKYELFYWDDHWVSAGEKTAKNDFLNYSNIPSGTIYWLKCLNGGNEERIFTYENEKQIWW